MVTDAPLRPTTGNRTRLFISYAREDQQLAQAIYAIFGDEHFDVWWDAKLRNNEGFTTRIQRQIDDADLVLVLWTQHSVGSEWVLAEAVRAEAKLFQVVVAGAKLPPPFNVRHYLEVKPEVITPIRDAVIGHLGLADVRDGVVPPDNATGREARFRRTHWVMLVGGMLVCCAVLYWLPMYFSAMHQPGLGVTIPIIDHELKFPYAWTSLVCVTCGATLVGLAFAAAKQVWKITLDWKTVSALVGLAAFVALFGVRSEPVKLEVVSSNQSLVGLTATFDLTPGGTIATTICDPKSTNCGNYLSSPCKLAPAKEFVTAPGARCVGRPQSFDRCRGVWPVVPVLRLNIEAEARPVPIRLSDKSFAPDQVKREEWQLLKTHLSVSTGIGSAAPFHWDADQAKYDCDPAIDPRPMFAMLDGQACSKPLPPNEFEAVGFDLLDCLAASKPKVVGSCLTLPTTALPVEYDVRDGSHGTKRMRQDTKLCVVSSEIRVCPVLFGVTKEASCTTVTHASPHESVASPRQCTEADLAQLCKHSEHPDTRISDCIRDLRERSIQPGRALNYRGRSLPTPNCKNMLGVKSGPASSACGPENCQ